LTVIEAAAARIPAIAPRSGGVIDTIEDGETGWLYEPQNEADFLNKLTTLINDSNLRELMGSNAQKLAQQYSWQQAVNNLLEFWLDRVNIKNRAK